MHHAIHSIPCLCTAQLRNSILPPETTNRDLFYKDAKENHLDVLSCPRATY